MKLARSVAWLVDPPDALPEIHGAGVRWIRRAWFAAMIVALAVQLFGAGYAFYDAYRVSPVLRAVGLATGLGDDDEAMVKPLTRETRAAGIKEGAVPVAIGHIRLDRYPTPPELMRALDATPGRLVPMQLRNSDGQIVTARLTRSDANRREVEGQAAVPAGVRMIVRLGFASLCSLSLLGSTALLFWKRPRDPEAMLIAFAFLAMAITVDPPLVMWMSLGFGWVINVMAVFWWPPIVIAIAAFPDGRFDPRWTRWTIPAALAVGLFLTSDDAPQALAIALGAGMPVLLVAMQIRRYRKLRTGIERQQLKWAAFGFATGFILLAASLVAVLVSQDRTWSPLAITLYNLAVVCTFSLAFAIMPLGLLISLLRFRLWEVDAVISRSAAYAATTTVVGIVWAASADLVKSFITDLLGQENVALSVVCSAALAATVFAPTQAIALSWSKRRLNRAGVRVEALPKRLRVWQEELDPAELGMRTLAVLVEGVHADAAVILLRTPVGRRVVASVELPDAAALADLPHAELAGDPRFARIVTLADDDGPVGWLAMGRRDDGNRYNRDQLDTIDGIAAPLAKALRIASANAARASRTRGDPDATGDRPASTHWDGQPRTT